MAREKKPARVREETKQLTCGTCGAGNRLHPSVVERGFQRCSHCDSAMPVEGAGSFAIESLAGGFTRVISPGKSVFVLILGRIVTIPAFVLALIGGEVLSAMMRHLLRLLGAPPLVSWIPVVVYVAAMVLIAAAFLTEQRLLVTQNRLEGWWRFFGLTLRHWRFGTHGLKLRQKKGWWGGLLLEPRSGRALLLRTEGAGPAELLKSSLEEAIEETQISIAADALACPGCGAPIATPLQVIEAGGVECPFCGSGLLATEGGVVLGRAKLSLAMTPLKTVPQVRRVRRPGGIEWRLRPELFARPFTAIGMMLAGLGCGGGMAVGGTGFLLSIEGFRSLALIFALILVPLGLSLLIYLFISALGSHRVLLDAGVLEHDAFLGPLRLKRRVIPLARLLELRAKVTPGSVTYDVKTALEETRFELVLLNGEGAVVTEELIEALAERLREMEREVRIERSNVVPPSSAA